MQNIKYWTHCEQLSDGELALNYISEDTLNAEEPVRVCMTHSMLISTEDYSRTNVLIKPFLMKIKIR